MLHVVVVAEVQRWLQRWCVDGEQRHVHVRQELGGLPAVGMQIGVMLAVRGYVGAVGW